MPWPIYCICWIQGCSASLLEPLRRLLLCRCHRVTTIIAPPTRQRMAQEGPRTLFQEVLAKNIPERRSLPWRVTRRAIVMSVSNPSGDSSRPTKDIILRRKP
jgi:hypothetical protein